MEQTKWVEMDFGNDLHSEKYTFELYINCSWVLLFSNL